MIQRIFLGKWINTHMRQIKYIPKKTTADTEYRQISRDDLNWILEKLQELQLFIDECQHTYDLEIQEVYAILCTPLVELPRTGIYPYKHNSIRSFTNGILKNFYAGTQRDLTNKTCSGLITIFYVCNELLNNWTKIEFVAVSQLDKQKPKKTKQITNSIENTNELFQF